MRRRKFSVFDRATSRPRRLRAVIVGSGIGLPIGLDTAGLDIRQIFDKGLTREILAHNDIAASAMSSPFDAALSSIEERADILAGYVLSARQAQEFILLAGMARPEWILLISPTSAERADILPILWRYGYGITDATLRACDYGAAEVESYAVIVARLGEREDFLLESLTDRAQPKPTPALEEREDLDPVTRASLRKGIPKDISLASPSNLERLVETSCPPMLAYHVGLAIHDRHHGIEIPEPDRDEYNRFIATNSDLDPEGRTIANFFSRVTRARRLLDGRTYRDHTAELAALERAVDAFNARTLLRNQKNPEENPQAVINASVHSDLRKALSWEHRMRTPRQQQRDAEIAATTLPPKVVSRKALPHWSLKDLKYALVPPPPLRDLVEFQPKINLNAGPEEEREEDTEPFDENAPRRVPPPPVPTSAGATKGLKKKDPRGRKPGFPTSPKPKRPKAKKRRKPPNP